MRILQKIRDEESIMKKYVKLALCGMFYAFIGENMDLEPDFEKRVLEGSVYVKGRLRTVHMAVFAAKMLLDKNIRSTYHDIREFKW